jgi:choline dehydrogenase-like flavoprotein
MAAYQLAVQGLKVLVLEAGRDYDPVTETPMFQTPKDAPLRGQRERGQAVRLLRRHGGRRLACAGRAVHHGAGQRVHVVALAHARRAHQPLGAHLAAHGPYDFKPKSARRTRRRLAHDVRDARAVLRQDRAAHRRVRRRRGSREHAASSPGVLQPPPAARSYELLTKKACDPMGIPVIPAHRAVLTQRQDAERLPARLHPGNRSRSACCGRACSIAQACFYATDCGRGCSIKANFQSTTVLLPPAMATGNVTIITDAMVREVTIDASGKATGVHYIDKLTRTTTRDGEGGGARGQCVRNVAHHAQQQEHAVSQRHRQQQRGRGQVPHGHRGRGALGADPALEGLPPVNEDGTAGIHMYMPWWLYGQQAEPHEVRARLPHRVRRRARHAGPRHLRRARRASPTAPTARSSRRRRVATTARSCTSTAAAR